MKIIKEGVIQYQWPYGEWTCENCNCVFLVEKDDPIEPEPTGYNRGDAQQMASIACPTCKQVQYSYDDYR